MQNSKRKEVPVVNVKKSLLLFKQYLKAHNATAETKDMIRGNKATVFENIIKYLARERKKGKEVEAGYEFYVPIKYISKLSICNRSTTYRAIQSLISTGFILNTETIRTAKKQQVTIITLPKKIVQFQYFKHVDNTVDNTNNTIPSQNSTNNKKFLENMVKKALSSEKIPKNSILGY